jgi:hypothetical protein
MRVQLRPEVSANGDVPIAELERDEVVISAPQREFVIHLGFKKIAFWHARP